MQRNGVPQTIFCHLSQQSDVIQLFCKTVYGFSLMFTTHYLSIKSIVLAQIEAQASVCLISSLDLCKMRNLLCQQKADQITEAKCQNLT